MKKPIIVHLLHTRSALPCVRRPEKASIWNPGSLQNWMTSFLLCSCKGSQLATFIQIMAIRFLVLCGHFMNIFLKVFSLSQIWIFGEKSDTESGRKLLKLHAITGIG